MSSRRNMVVFYMYKIWFSRFLECAETIVTCGMQRRIGNLEFIHSVVAQLHDSDEVYLKIWTCLAQEAVTYLEEVCHVFLHTIFHV